MTASGNDTAAIRAEGLRKEYGDTVAVADLSLRVPSGTVYGFLGPNGAGKTTTMRMLTTLTTPTAGDAWINGVPITDRTAAAKQLGYLPTDSPLHDELTGYEQLELVAGLREIDPATAERRIESLLTQFDLADAADERISGYSTGMRQKLGVIAAILHEPSVVFLDEPTAGLDPRAAQTMRDTVESMADRDVTVFLSSHILPVVEDLADRVGVLDDGQLVAEGTPEELIARADTTSGNDATGDSATESVSPVGSGPADDDGETSADNRAGTNARTDAGTGAETSADDDATGERTLEDTFLQVTTDEDRR